MSSHTAPAMSSFERYLSLWVAACILVGIALGAALPSLFGAIAGAELARVNLPVAALVWLTQSLRFIELVLDRGLSFTVFIELTGLLLPSFFAVILPITTFVFCLFVYVRLDSDRELVVMRAAGLSQWRLVRPALALAGIVVVLCYALNLWLVPASQAAFALKMGYVPTVKDAKLPDDLAKQISLTEAQQGKLHKLDYAFMQAQQSGNMDFWNKEFKA